MATRVYALLVGINDYPSEVGKLTGCLNDVDHFQAYLSDNFDKADLAIEVLKDSEATRDNVIKQFRGHLGKAREGDVALFHYCGHGARWASAKAFKEFYPDGKDEGLVCIDSRRPEGFDLADKELAILISDVAKNNSHLAVMLDCCHSGSGTRWADSFRGLRPRLTYEVADERPLESYLDSYYADLRRKNQPLFIPTSRHILLAACERTQLAQESPDRSGVFTSTLVEVLNKSAGDVTYSDLFVRCRAAVRARADNQNPQFEAYGNFNASSGFLGRKASYAERRFSVCFDKGSWKVDCGAIHGVPTDPEKIVALALYPEDDQAHQAGTATVVQVGPQRSELKLGFARDESARYRAEITSLPLPPMPIYFKEETRGLGLLLQEAIKNDGAVNVTLTDIEEGTRYALSREGGNLLLKQRETDLPIQGVEVDDSRPEDAANTMVPILKHVAGWERSVALQNPRTQMDPSLVDFIFAERLDDGTEHIYPTGEIILDYAKSGGQWREIRGKLKARNRTQQTLHAVLAYFSKAYGIHILKNDPIDPGDSYVTLWGDLPEDYFYLEDGDNESIENFKLIVSTEKVDDFLLSQDGLVMGKIARGARTIGSVKPMTKLVQRNEWFTKNCRIKVVRRLDQLGARDSVLARGKIVVKGHPSITANLSLSAAKSHARGAGEADFYKAFERYGMEMLNFAGTRGDNESVLELTDIQNAASLQDDPLHIEVNVPLKENEAILPLVFDGQHVLLGGDPYKDDNGNTHISIHHVLEVADHRRSLGSALKLYFFKTYLRENKINRLRSIQYGADGSFTYQEGSVADKVAAAQNILLLVHGIIGDTEGMVAGVKTCGLDRKFDLVLAYDYENLSTPIAETARALKSQLATAGLHGNDDKQLTLLVAPVIENDGNF
jgi:Caspase domain